jgi:hypothetical protein
VSQMSNNRLILSHSTTVREKHMYEWTIKCAIYRFRGKYDCIRCNILFAFAIRNELLAPIKASLHQMAGTSIQVNLFIYFFVF